MTLRAPVTLYSLASPGLRAAMDELRTELAAAYHPQRSGIARRTQHRRLLQRAEELAEAIGGEMGA
jgi:hypothetical protein